MEKTTWPKSQEKFLMAKVFMKFLIGVLRLVMVWGEEGERGGEGGEEGEEGRGEEKGAWNVAQISRKIFDGQSVHEVFNRCTSASTGM